MTPEIRERLKSCRTNLRISLGAGVLAVVMFVTFAASMAIDDGHLPASISAVAAGISLMIAAGGVCAALVDLRDVL